MHRVQKGTSHDPIVLEDKKELSAAERSIIEQYLKSKLNDKSLHVSVCQSPPDGLTYLLITFGKEHHFEMMEQELGKDSVIADVAPYPGRFEFIISYELGKKLISRSLIIPQSISAPIIIQRKEIERRIEELRAQEIQSGSIVDSSKLVTFVGVDKFFHGTATPVSLLNSMRQQRYGTLEHYLQTGANDLLTGAYREFFYGQDEYKPSTDWLELICLIRNTSRELTNKLNPENSVRCLPIFKKSEEGLSCEHAVELLTYISDAFPLNQTDKEKLKSFLLAIPPEERFYTTIKYSQKLMLSAFKVFLDTAISDLQEKECADFVCLRTQFMAILLCSDNPYNKQLRFLAENALFGRRGHLSLQTESNPDISAAVKSLLIRIREELQQAYSFTRNENARSNLHFQLLISNASVIKPILSQDGKSVLHVCVSNKILDKCHALFYGEENSVTRLTCFGVFTEEDVATATKANARLINAQDPARFSSLMMVHSAPASPWTLHFHDIIHHSRMWSIPSTLKQGMIEWANALQLETNMRSFGLIAALFDMDLAGFQFIPKDSPHRTSIEFNIAALTARLSAFQGNQYMLLLIYIALKDRQWMERTFAHCVEPNKIDYLPTLLSTLTEVIDQISQQDIYNLIIKYFVADTSPTFCVFSFLLSEQNKDTLSLDNAYLILTNARQHLNEMERSNVFKWTKSGLTLTTASGESLTINEVNNHNVNKVVAIFTQAKSGTASVVPFSLLRDQKRPRLQDFIDSPAQSPSGRTVINLSLN